MTHAGRRRRSAPRIRPAAALLAGALAAAACVLGEAPPAWDLPPPPVRDAPVVDASRLTRTRLPNGIEVIVLEDHRLPQIEIGVTARRGAASVDPARAGLAAFTAELMERGAGERTALELAAVVDRLGATLSVSHDWDALGAGVSGLSRDLEPLFQVLEDVVRRPRFDEDEAERVRSELLAARVRARDDPETLARCQFAHTLYDGHRYGAPEEGSEEGLRGLAAADARAFHAAVFVPSNLIVHAVGDLRSEDVVGRARAAFGDLPADDPLPLGPAPEEPAPPARRVVIVDRPDLGQAQILVGHEGIESRDERRVPALLLSTVLGQGGFSSRLMSRVRAQEGLTYGVYSVFAQRREGGPFLVSTFTRVAETGRVVELVLQELERLHTEPPLPEELAKAQSLRTGSFALTLETSASVLAALVDLSVQGLPEESLDTYRARVRAVTPDQVAQVARELIHPERAAIVVVGPAEALRPQLEGFGPVQVVAR